MLEVQLKAPASYAQNFADALTRAGLTYDISPTSKIDPIGEVLDYYFTIDGDHSEWERANDLLKELQTFNAGVWYSPKNVELIDKLAITHNVQILSTYAVNVFGKTLRLRSGIRGHENDLGNFFNEFNKAK